MERLRLRGMVWSALGLGAVVGAAVGAVNTCLTAAGSTVIRYGPEVTVTIILVEALLYAVAATVAAVAAAMAASTWRLAPRISNAGLAMLSAASALLALVIVEICWYALSLDVWEVTAAFKAAWILGLTLLVGVFVYFWRRRTRPA